LPTFFSNHVVTSRLLRVFAVAQGKWAWQGDSSTWLLEFHTAVQFFFCYSKW